MPMPVRFKRVAEAFGDMARARLCESSGSEHSPESSMDLSDLVNSFLERESGGEREDCELDEEEKPKRCESETYDPDYEAREKLEALFGCEGDEVKRNVYEETDGAYRAIGDRSWSSPGFKRRLMARLRERGFDAGLCKSKWKSVGRVTSGSYEYIDINIAGTRHIIEVSLATQFQIARATKNYTSLLETFPPIFVGKVEELKQIMKIMCKEIKSSMKRMEMHVPPWKRSGYMNSKWFGSYKRTINEVPVEEGLDSDKGLAGKRLVGFVLSPEVSYHYCREKISSKFGLRVGKLAMEFSGTTMLL